MDGHSENDYKQRGYPIASDSVEGSLRKLNYLVAPGPGSRVIVPADGEVTGRFKSIVAFETTEISHANGPTFGDGALDEFTLGDGQEISGEFTSIQLTSGRVIAYA